MTQNTEQNVRTAREQDGQVQEMHADMVKAVCGRRSDYPEDVFRAYLKRHIAQAEARGAEEQRRKDAEGQEVAGKVIATFESGEFMVDPHPQTNRVKTGEYVYTRPANVAALVSRIADLVEAEQLARADAEASKARVMVLEEEKNHEFNRGYLIACCNVANMHDEPVIACDVLAEGGLTEDDIEAAKLAEYDATALLEIRRARGDQDPISATITRVGVV